MARLPHIVIFNPDQWRGDVLGHLGNPAAVTPCLDRLAATDAVSFRHAFCQNPVCTPSRCSFMTGWYPHVRGHRTMHHMLHAEWGEPNLLALLKAHGYFVWWGGKNDLLPGEQAPWPESCDLRFQPSPEDYARWGTHPREHHHDRWRGAPEDDTYYGFHIGRHDTEGDAIYGDADWANVLGAIDFLHRYDGDRPLCLYLPLLFPHPPYGVEEPWFSCIDRDRLPARTPAPADWRGKPAILRGIWERQRLQGWTEARWTELRAAYYGMCARTDHQLGLLLDALRVTGRYDDSAVFVFADHGDFTGDFGLVEKTQNTFEDCLARVPFVVKPPAGVPVQPRVSEALVELVDFSATVFALTGIAPGYTHYGRSLLPVLAGDTDAHRDAVFCEGGRCYGEREATEYQSTSAAGAEPGPYWPRVGLQQRDDGPWHTRAAMCRTRDHKYVRRLYEPDELYDLRSDPREERNRIDDPAYAATRARLQDRLLRWYIETCDVVPHQGDRRW